MEQLTFNFSATNYNGWPSAKILINNNVIQDFVIDNSNQSVTVNIDYDQGLHDLEIHRYGKTDCNVLFVDGKILQDQTLTLNSIYYRNVRLPDRFLFNSWYSWDGNDYKSVLTWGPNGVWRWQFGMPFVQWSVDSSEHQTHFEILAPHKNNEQVLKDKIKTLRSIWQ